MKKKNIVIMICIAIVCILSLIIFNQSANNTSFNKAKELFESGKYYESVSEYYETLNSSNKQKIEKLLLEKISNVKWKSQNQMKYGNFNDCLGNEYVEISNSITHHYVVCEENKYDYSENSQIIFSLESIDNSKVVFKLTPSDNLYLFIYRSDDINIETSSVNSSRNYQMQYHKFVIEE